MSKRPCRVRHESSRLQSEWVSFIQSSWGWMSARLTRSRICSTYAVRNAWTVARRYRATRSLETSAIPDNGSTNTARHTSHVTIFGFPPNCPSISLLLHDRSFFIAQDVHFELRLGEGHATTMPTGGEPSDRYPWGTVCLAICPPSSGSSIPHP